VPDRFFDTRPIDAPLGPNGFCVVYLGFGGLVPPDTVDAAVLNVTVTQPTAAGYLTVFDDDCTIPLSSNLNFTPGQTVANQVVTGLSSVPPAGARSRRSWHRAPSSTTPWGRLTSSSTCSGTSPPPTASPAPRAPGPQRPRSPTLTTRRSSRQIAEARRGPGEPHGLCAKFLAMVDAAGRTA
jgi:hypothetical protein